MNGRPRLQKRALQRGARGLRWIFGGLLAGLTVCGVWLFTSGAWKLLPGFARGQGVFGWLLAIALVAVQSLVPYAPFVLIAGIMGYVHGFWAGALATWAGALLGACAVFALARGAARAVSRGRVLSQVRRYPRIAAALSRLRSQSPMTAGVLIAALRLQPWLPSSLVDLAAAVAGVRWPVFVIASGVGLLPIVAAHVYVGGRVLAAAAQARELWWFAAAGIAAAAGYGGWRWWRRRRHR
ncbi:MAG: VTT domain-containing protein [Firmicutes bacterium]|nr:VTT domain-containing protein [Bacillota bacterium]